MHTAGTQNGFDLPHTEWLLLLPCPASNPVVSLWMLQASKTTVSLSVHTHQTQYSAHSSSSVLLLFCLLLFWTWFSTQEKSWNYGSAFVFQFCYIFMVKRFSLTSVQLLKCRHVRSMVNPSTTSWYLDAVYTEQGHGSTCEVSTQRGRWRTL